MSVSYSGTTATFVYDGDGNRVMKTEGGETTIYVNRYYEVNITTGNATSSYYLGGKLVATSENGTLRYLHQDHLTGTSLMTDTNGNQIDTTVKYYPFGSTISGDVPTDKLFTGQRLDQTGLYFYNARYYDATIGRFISPDTIIPNPANPQSFNRYSYCLNNPLKYIDPSGNSYLEDLLMLDYLLDGGELTEEILDSIYTSTSSPTKYESQLPQYTLSAKRRAPGFSDLLIGSSGNLKFGITVSHVTIKDLTAEVDLIRKYCSIVTQAEYSSGDTNYLLTPSPITMNMPTLHWTTWDGKSQSIELTVQPVITYLGDPNHYFVGYSSQIPGPQDCKNIYRMDSRSNTERKSWRCK